MPNRKPTDWNALFAAPVPSHGRVRTIGPDARRPVDDRFDWFKQIREISRDWNSDTLAKGKTPPRALRMAENWSGNTDDILGASPITAGTTVFHGTGAPKFLKWNWDKIGSGSGGSVYSHGVYNAGDVEHADNYYDSLKRLVSGVRYKGMPLDDAYSTIRSSAGIPVPAERLSQKQFQNYQRQMNQARKAAEEKVKALANVGMQYNRTSHSDPAARLAAAYRETRRSYADELRGLRSTGNHALAASHDKAVIKPRAQFLKKSLGPDLTAGESTEIGGIVKSDLPDEYISRMLRWDSPLYEQPSRVQEFLTHQAPGTKDSFFNLLTRLYKADHGTTSLSTSPGSMLGADIQRGLATALNPADKTFRSGLSRIYNNPSHTADPAISDLLDSAGIAGVKYRVTGSKAPIESPRSFNYVSYRNFLPKILDYYPKARRSELGLF